MARINESYRRLRAGYLFPEIGRRVRAMMASHGIKSVAAEGFQAPGVVVSFTDDDGLHSAKAFIAEGVQTASGVPLMCDEGPDYKTFRVGLFGLEKLHHPERSVANLEAALVRILAAKSKSAA